MFAAVLLAAAVGAAPRPPDGTYSYRVMASGQDVEDSRVSIGATESVVTVTDSTRIGPGESVLATSAYDATTLHQIAYRAEYRTASGNRPVLATFAPGSIAFASGGRSVSVPPDPSAPLEIVSDNLAGTMVMIPALLRAAGTHALTLAVTSGGGLALRADVNLAPPDARPSGVPASDRSLALVLASANLREIYWYDPQTFVLHDVEIPAQAASVALVASSALVQPVQTPAPAVTPVPTPQPHFTSADVVFTSADGTRLTGTLTVPNGATKRLPAVVLVAGSGPETRDETIGPNAIFLQLSNALSNAGYVVLRYDKRGAGSSGGSAASETRNDLLADVRSALNFARSQRSVDPKRVYLLGHSEGGELVATVAASDSRVAGIILMASPALTLWKVSMEQFLDLHPFSERASAAATELAALAAIRNGKDRAPGMIWYRTSMDVDPAVDIARLRVPVLILQGAADTQVLAKDLPRLVAAAKTHNRNVTVDVFRGDTHLFMKGPPGKPATLRNQFAYYYAAAQRVDPVALAAIVAWLKAR